MIRLQKSPAEMWGFFVDTAFTKLYIIFMFAEMGYIASLKDKFSIANLQRKQLESEVIKSFDGSVLAPKVNMPVTFIGSNAADRCKEFEDVIESLPSWLQKIIKFVDVQILIVDNWSLVVPFLVHKEKDRLKLHKDLRLNSGVCLAKFSQGKGSSYKIVVPLTNVSKNTENPYEPVDILYHELGHFVLCVLYKAFNEGEFKRKYDEDVLALKLNPFKDFLSAYSYFLPRSSGGRHYNDQKASVEAAAELFRCVLRPNSHYSKRLERILINSHSHMRTFLDNMPSLDWDNIFKEVSKNNNFEIRHNNGMTTQLHTP